MQPWIIKEIEKQKIEYERPSLELPVPQERTENTSTSLDTPKEDRGVFQIDLNNEE